MHYSFKDFSNVLHIAFETLSFHGMEPSQGSLLESLGSIGNFVTNSPPLYGIDQFLSYIQSVKSEMDQEIKIPSSAR